MSEVIYIPIYEETLFTNKYTEVKSSTIRKILESIIYFIDLQNIVISNTVDINSTIVSHSGDSRLWWKDEGYDNLNDYKGVIVKRSKWTDNCIYKLSGTFDFIDYIEEIDIELYNDIQSKLNKNE